jgi:hypothetical protein
MSTPSLLNIPYVIKAGTLYSQIPETGAGDFAVTRATSPANNRSTRVNSLGFIERVNDNVPRLDYPLGGAVNGCASLLVEPSAANNCFQSEGLSTSPWIAGSVTVTGTTQTNSPDGTQNAFDITIANTGFSTLRQFIACANNTTYTVSCFYKNKALVAGQTFEMRYTNENLAPNNLNAIATIDLAAGTATYQLAGTSGTGFSGTATGRVENYGNGWYRVSMTFTVGSAGANVSGIFRPIVGVSVSRNFYAWGAQMEVGSVPTSYIPTTTQAITRGDEVIRKTNVASLIGQTEGVLYLEFIPPSGYPGRIFAIDDGTLNNRIAINRATSTRLEVVVRSSGSVVNGTIGSSAATAFNPDAPNKVAYAYKSGDFALAINGSVVASGTTTFAFTGTLNNLGTSESLLGAIFIDRIRAVAIYPNRLTNAQLATLTTP